MTHLMETAIERLRSLPEQQQDQLAKLVLSELDDDLRWSASTVANSEPLKRLIKKVLADDDAGNCQPLNPDTL